MNHSSSYPSMCFLLSPPKSVFRFWTNVFSVGRSGFSFFRGECDASACSCCSEALVLQNALAQGAIVVAAHSGIAPFVRLCCGSAAAPDGIEHLCLQILTQKNPTSENFRRNEIFVKQIDLLGLSVRMTWRFLFESSLMPWQSQQCIFPQNKQFYLSENKI